MRRLPFLSPLALGAALATAVVVAAMWWLTGGGLASPGPLGGGTGDGVRRGGVSSHAGLDHRCGACHPAPWTAATTSDRCLACHDEIQAELAGADGLHAHFRATRSCLACHTEHRGRDGALTGIDAASFPHAATGFSLAAHRRTRAGCAFACADCHDQALTRWDEQRCETCHRAEQPALMTTHVAAWGADCRACHDGVDRFGAAFDHARTRLALAGKHAALACQQCHPDVRRAAGFADAPERCVDCHRDDDAHRGRYGEDCGRCHGDAGWKPARFDHGTTAFPLTGAHVRATCAACHPDQRYQGTATACASCHPMPADHRGTFGDNCAGCHSTDTWARARFDHRFPIDHGDGRAVPCKTCHPVDYRSYTCYGCHEHTIDNIARKHRKEGIGDYRPCARCHPTGREDEGDDD